MKFTQENAAGHYRVRSYDDHEVVVEWGGLDADGKTQLNFQSLSGSFLISADGLVSEDLPASVEGMEVSHLQPLLDQQIEVILLGTGAQMVFPDAKLIAWLSQAGIGLEVMSTAAACRTYNLLMLEDRRVAAMILLG